MTKRDIPFFGMQEIHDGGVEATNTLTLNGKTAPCHFSIFGEVTNDPKVLDQALTLLIKLPELDQVARSEMQKLLDDDSKDNTVSSFIFEHFTEYGSQINAQIAEKIGTSDQNRQLFLENMELGNIFFVLFQDDEKSYAELSLDYSLIWEDGAPFTDQIITVNFDEIGQFLYLAHES